MLILGLDTSLQSCSAALIKGDTVLAQQAMPLERGHAEHIAPMVQAVLSDADIHATALDRIGVATGPGAFAGVRVGIALARGMCLGTSVHPIGIDSLSALAASINKPPADHLIAVVLNARRGQLYAGLYSSSGSCVLSPFAAAPNDTLTQLQRAADNHPVAIIGHGAGLLPSPPASWHVGDEHLQIDPAALARLAAKAPPSSPPPTPLYLRAPDAAPGRPSLFAGLVAPS